MKHIFLLHYPDKIVRFKAENVGEQMERAIKLYGLPESIECRENCEIIELPEDSVSTDYLDSCLKSFQNKSERDMIEKYQRELYKP